MAAPAEKTLQNLNGNWTINSTLSDDIAPAMKLQGVNYFLRAASSYTTVHMKVMQPDKDHIHIKQYATALKLPGTEEEYILDWQWRGVKDPLYGDLEGRSRWLTREEAKKEGATDDWIEGDSEGMQIHTDTKKPDGSWGSINFWGFVMEGGVRRYMRRVKVWTKDGREHQLKLVYDFNGE